MIYKILLTLNTVSRFISSNWLADVIFVKTGYAVSIENKPLSTFEAENLLLVLCVPSCRSVLMNSSQARILISISIVSCMYKVY